MKLPLLTVAIAFVGSIMPAATAGMEISPVLVEVGPATPSAVVTVRNGGAAPTRYQVTAAAWIEPRGEVKIVPSSELSAFPPLFQLGPGQERKIRVGATVPPAATERAWRLFVEEIPSAVEAPSGGTHVRFRTRFAIPVFQAPARAQPRGEVSLALEGGVLQAIVRNAGNVHLRPAAKVALLDAAGEKLDEAEVAPTYVLPAVERVTPVPVPKEICAKVRSAVLVADLANEKQRAALALPDGACAP